MRTISLILIAACVFVLPGCAVVRTTASVAGTVVSTTVGVTGAVVTGAARVVTGGGDDEESE